MSFLSNVFKSHMSIKYVFPVINVFKSHMSIKYVFPVINVFKSHMSIKICLSSHKCI